MTTTCIYGNDQARRLYESQGFVFADQVDNDETHEINLIYHHRKDPEEAT